MSEGIDRYNVKIDYVGGEPIVSMQKQNHGPYVSYDEYEVAIRASQAHLSEAVKVLERVKGVVTYPCDRSIQERGYGVRSIDVSGCEYIAEAIDAFIATLGEET